MTEIFSDEDTTRLFQLVHMFQRSALLHMGYIPDQNGNKYFDMAEAKEAIDLLSMLQNKTKGNLTDKETQLLQKNRIKENDLFVSPIDLNDNNIPNGNSVYLNLCNKIYTITNDKIWFKSRKWGTF